MKPEEKELLLKDLCARLPYQPLCKKVDTEDDFCECDAPLGYSLRDLVDNKIIIKPYLRPMSSMTEEECIELSTLSPYETDAWKYIKTPVPLHIANIKQFDFFHRNHLDWRGLIPKGLAIEVTKENNPYKE